MKNLERRFAPTEFAVSKEGIISGYAAKFGTRSQYLFEDGEWFYETIQPGAFKRSLDEIKNQFAEGRDVIANIEHDDKAPLARLSAGTLLLEETAEGLRFEITTNPKSARAAQAIADIEHGNYKGCSFAFLTKDQSESYLESGEKLRTLNDCDLFDVCLTTTPAYIDTEVAVRSLKQWEQEQQPKTTPPETWLKLIEILSL